MIELADVLENVKELIKEIGKYQLDNFNKTLEVEWKSTENDLVTNVDKNSEMKIISFIKENYPSHAIKAEEGGNVDNNSEYRWIIDPLDGTNNFAHGFPVFSISIALEYENDIVLAVVYNPLLGELFYAIKGEGSFLNGKPINVSTNQDLKHALLATGFPYDKAEDPDNNLDHFNRIVPRIRGLRRTGSAAYDLCNVARGSLDGFWELKLSLWDVAAGKLIIEEAGGKVILIEDTDSVRIIAGNKVIVDVLLEELRAENDYWSIS